MSGLRITLPLGARVEMQDDGHYRYLFIANMDENSLAEGMLRLSLELMSKQAQERRDCGEDSA